MPQTIDFQKVPIQTVNDVLVLRSDNGQIVMRMMAPKMDRYSYVLDSISNEYDFYPDGFFVYVYTEEGALETRVTSREAKHVTTKGKEEWIAIGDVLVINYLEREQVESDTLYWDQEQKLFHTDCYVKLSSASGMMQGFGMQSDERARNVTILRPFNSYSTVQDSTQIFIDTTNFIGPLMQRF